MNTIALFGGSGRTGQEFLKLALDKGYAVRALARTPAKIPQNSHQLAVIKGDVLDYDTVLETLTGADIVVSLFGHVKGSEADVQTRGTANIVKAMQAEGIQRIISLSGGGLPFPAKDQPKFADHLIRTIMKIAVPNVLKDAKNHHALLHNSDREWTIVRGPRLTDDPKKGDYRVGWVGVNASTKIGRADLADFILRELEQREFAYQMPFVSY